MQENLYVVVTLYPFYQLTNQSAGAPKKFLVEVPKAAVEKFEKPAAETRIVVELATKTALDADTAHFGLDSGIRHDIDTRLVTLEQEGKQMLEAPYVFNDCRAWAQQAP
jgi:hypothetical protein